MTSRLSDTDRIFSALFILVSLAFLAEANRTWATEVGEKVAVVGKTAITEKEISYKIHVEKAYGNEGATEEATLISLINDAIDHETATIHGVTITQEEIGSLKRYVDENTKAPEILEKVKLAFGDDEASYERIYLAPKIMNWKLRSFYSRNPEFHRRARLLIEKAYGLVSSGRSFQDAANECGLQYSTFDIGDQVEAVAKELKGYMAQNNTPAKDPLVPILEGLSPGEIYRNIVEDDSAYKIIKLSGRSGNTFSVEEITARKQPFDEWLKEEAARLNIEVLEPALKNRIRSTYPDLWWVKQYLKDRQWHQSNIILIPLVAHYLRFRWCGVRINLHCCKKLNHVCWSVQSATGDEKLGQLLFGSSPVNVSSGILQRGRGHQNSSDVRSSPQRLIFTEDADYSLPPRSGSVLHTSFFNFAAE